MYQTWQLASAHADHEEFYGFEASHPKGRPVSNLKPVIRHIVASEGLKQ